MSSTNTTIIDTRRLSDNSCESELWCDGDDSQHTEQLNQVKSASPTSRTTISRPKLFSMVSGDTDETLIGRNVIVRGATRFSIMSEDDFTLQAAQLQTLEHFIDRKSSDPTRERNLSAQYEALDHYWLLSNEEQARVAQARALQDSQQEHAATTIQAAVRGASVRRKSRYQEMASYELDADKRVRKTEVRGQRGTRDGRSPRQLHHVLPSAHRRARSAMHGSRDLPDVDILSRPLPTSVESLREEARAIREILATLRGQQSSGDSPPQLQRKLAWRISMMKSRDRGQGGSHVSSKTISRLQDKSIQRQVAASALKAVAAASDSKGGDDVVRDCKSNRRRGSGEQLSRALMARRQVDVLVADAMRRMASCPPKE
eukprot:TRINITY_DN49263_c0_g1_i1.p1 TRINITY_DN49263_c0_g1~~TRINITY_DN49263_c0_g1_i1.p1  ORF type:complete len:373 (+),score=49.43 TRINITY_DN49263_c0_g1_i1:337-1455(+)